MSREEGTKALELGWCWGDWGGPALTTSLGSQEVIQDFQASVLQVSDSPYDEQ